MLERVPFPLVALSKIAVLGIGLFALLQVERVIPWDALRCDNLGWFGDLPVGVGDLVIRAGRPVCIRALPYARPTIEAETPRSWFAEAGAPDWFEERPYRIELSTSNGYLLSYTRPYGQSFKLTTDRTLDDGTTIQVFADRYGGTAPDPLIVIETVIRRPGETIRIRGSTSNYFTQKNYRSPFANAVTHQWDGRFAVEYDMWAVPNETLERFQERAIALAASIRDFIESASKE